VVLVDNGSRDGSTDYVRAHYPWVELVPLPENLGFAAANNLGLEACRGTYILTLNNDTKLAPDFLSLLIAAAEGASAVGMFMPKMLNFFHSGKIDSVGISPKRSGLGVSLGYGVVDSGQYDEAREVFGPSAGAALYRRSMLDEIGFFDADFFAYYEDLDLAWRARLAGWKCVTVPAAVVFHVHSGTSGSDSAFKIFHLHRNKWWTLIKNWPARLLLWNLPYILIIDLAALLRAVWRGHGLAAIRARWAVLRSLPQAFGKRRKIQTRNPADLSTWLA